MNRLLSRDPVDIEVPHFTKRGGGERDEKRGVDQVEKSGRRNFPAAGAGKDNFLKDFSPGLFEKVKN